MAKISRLEIPSAPLNDNELHFAFINFFVDFIYYRFQQLCVSSIDCYIAGSQTSLAAS